MINQTQCSDLYCPVGYYADYASCMCLADYNECSYTLDCAVGYYADYSTCTCQVDTYS